MTNKEKGNKRVVVGMSGGIDSSAVCMLLQEQGYEVIGLTLRIRDLSSHFSTPQQTEPNHVLEARALADKMGFPHFVLDVRKEFREIVIRHFIDEYLRGRTPNPCVLCNRFFKWKYLLKEAERLDCSHVATGHYARIDEINGHYYISKGIDPQKDQSYFLWRLSQDELAHTLFPLGGLTKESIKEYVLNRGFKEKVEKKESMEVCFIEDDYRAFLSSELPSLAEEVNGGYFIDNSGRKIGKHKGFPFYTIGQRKGLEIALGYPAYVIKINPFKNTIRLGKKEELEVSEMLVQEYTIPDISYFSSFESLNVRIRYRSEAIPARIQIVDDNQLVVKFSQPASAIAAGQSAVFYHGDTIIGGGIIGDQRLLKKIRTA